MKKLHYFLAALGCIVLLTWGCKKDKPTCDGSDPNYDQNIKSIINTNCTSSNCHPSYSSYDGIESILRSGSFKKEVLEKQSMPEGRTLSSSQLNSLQCWVENGYKEAP